MRCKACGKPLTGSESMMLGVGPVCRKHRAEALQPHLPNVRPSISIADFDETDFDPYWDEGTVKQSLTVEPDVIDWDALCG